MGYFDAAARALAPGDGDAARALARAGLGGTPYIERVLELLSTAEQGSPESRALIIERDGTVAALALYGPVAGAQAVWRLAMVLVAGDVALREVGRAIIDAVVAAVREANARLLVAELPADEVLGRTLSLLRANGFTQDARIPDFYRDGVAMLFLRRVP